MAAGSTFFRMKYRPEPIQPSAVDVQPNQHMSLMKRIHDVPEEEEFDPEKFRYQDPFMSPNLTQRQTVSHFVESNEKDHRDKESPSFHVRLREHQNYLNLKKKVEHFKEIMVKNQEHWDGLVGDNVSNSYYVCFNTVMSLQ